MYAIVEIGAKQYKIEKGMLIDIDKVNADKETFKIDRVLMCVDGEKVLVGKPCLNNVTVSANIVSEVAGKKVVGVKFKKRKNSETTYGARANYLRLKIEDIVVA